MQKRSPAAGIPYNENGLGDLDRSKGGEENLVKP
jgi:hypothetical protein